MSNKLKVGDHIYLPSSPSSFDEMKYSGGKATISRISSAKSSASGFVEVKELPEHWFNLDFLLLRQEELAEQFGEDEVCLDKSEVKQILKEQIQATLVAFESIRSYTPLVFSDPGMDEYDFKQVIKSLKQMKKELR